MSVLEAIVTNESPLYIVVVNVNPSGSLAVGSVYNFGAPNGATTSVGGFYVR